jgi:LysR family transcriptional regulator, glycine cleavage system transcriptional activator
MLRTLPGLSAIKAFDAAARLLSFTKAAQELSVTPAAVSHQIKELEDQIGVSLFLRTSRSMRLTREGEILRLSVCFPLYNGQMAGTAPRSFSGIGARRGRQDRRLAIGSRF